MHAFSRLALVPAAAIAMAAAPAAAQQGTARLVANTGPVPASATVVPVAVYRFRAAHAAGIPAQITVADSAGQLVASFRLPDEARSHPMMVDADGGGLVLQGETPAGILTLLFSDPDANSAGATAGHWWLEGRDGDLRGRVIR